MLKKRVLGLLAILSLILLFYNFKYTSAQSFGDGFGACPGSSQLYGFCTFLNTTILTTDYSSYVGFGQITPVPSTSLQASATPIIRKVLQQNTANNDWLITCPVAPDPQETTDFFVTDPDSFVAGNRCLAQDIPLLTLIQYDTFVVWTPVTPAYAYSIGPLVQNIAQGTVTNIGYSGSTATPGTGSGTVSTSSSTTTTGSTTTVPAGQCPNTLYGKNQGGSISSAQAIACAQNAGFSGVTLQQIVSIAYQESTFRPGAFGPGISTCLPGQGAEGILQEGACGAPGEKYPLSDYNPSSCSTYNGNDWGSIYYNPTCAFQWAFAFENSGNKGVNNCNAGDYCFWGAYRSGAYCKYAPTTYSGWACPQGQNKAGIWTGGTSGSGGNGNSGGGGNVGSGYNSQYNDYNISNGYDSQSYVFGQVPASPQHGVWTWSAEYADLSKTNLAKLNVEEEWDGLELITPACVYFYDYQLSSYVSSIENTNVSIPTFNQTAYIEDNYINFGGYLFSPVTTSSSTGGGLFSSSCYTQLNMGQGCGGWIKVSENATLDEDGTVYNGLNAYIGGSNPSPPSQYSSTVMVAYDDGFAFAPAVINSNDNVSIVPYMLYNLTIPSAYTQLGTSAYLNLSYNLYSTHNLLDPQNSLDGISLYQSSGFFGDYNGFLSVFPYNVLSIVNPNPNGLGGPEGNFLSSQTYDAATANSFAQKSSGTQMLGGLAYGWIQNPTAIAASPNGYVYVLNYTSSCSWWTLCLNTYTKSYLFTFRFIPQGYYNLSTYQFSNQHNGQSSFSAWQKQWSQYFLNTLLDGSQNLYITSIFQLSSTRSSWWRGIKDYPSGSQLSEVLPMSIATDSAGDLFVLGQHLGGASWTNAPPGFPIAGFFSNSVNVINTQITSPQNFIPSSEFAASPGGQFVYAANASDPTDPEVNGQGVFEPGTGAVNIYSAVSQFSFVANIPLGYSNSTYNVNIAKYLAAGGPYHDPQVATAYASYLTSNPNNPSDYDTYFNHHPVSIVDSKGIVYVIDNWTFSVDNERSSVLMLRAFSENGVEIPLDPTLVNTLALVNTNGNNGNSIVQINPPYGWAPYGWPLSANITLPSGTTVSYCVAQCTKDASSNDIQTGYPPIGPRTDEISGGIGQGSNSIAISADFNGTLYLIAHSWSFKTNSATCASILSYLYNNLGRCADKPLYTELLVLRPNLENYTKISLADNSTFSCYINITVSGDTCISDENTQATLGNLYPPLIGVPSAFDYVQSSGGEQYLSLSNEFSAVFPAGISSSQYQSSVNNQFSTGISGGPNYNQLATGPLTGTAPNGKLSSSFLRTNIKGYLFTPWNSVTVIKQYWNYYLGVPVPPNLFCPSFVFGTSVTTPSFKYYVTQMPASKNVNETLESGGTYLKYIPVQTNYVQNLSDVGLITSPIINYQIFTNRLMGEIYINQTINPSTATSQYGRSGLPVVVNATQNYNYQPLNYQQVSKFGDEPAYYTQIAVPSTTTPNTTKIGANCGSSCPLLNYYYANKYFSGHSNLTFFNSNITQFFPLFELYKRATYLQSLVLSFPKENSVLGYNRLIYTFVDRFNNTIYLPLDVNFANITELSLNSSTSINASNANQTTISVNGIAAYVTLSGIKPVPSGSNIYLYYDGNLNYYNTTSSPSSNPVNYYKYALTCAYSPTSKNCVLANPLSTQTQQQPIGGQESNAVSYKPNYQSGSTCSQPSNSLLYRPTYNCNLFNQFNLQSVQFGGGIGSYQYCVPLFVNGTGLFSSQLGLIGVVQTGSGGTFNDIFNACGVGQNRVTAYYYGNPAPEPANVVQTPLTYSAGANEINPQNAIHTQEYNYQYSPNESTTGFEIGSYALSIGTINILELLAAMGIIIAIILIQRTKEEKKMNT